MIVVKKMGISAHFYFPIESKFFLIIFTLFRNNVESVEFNLGVKVFKTPSAPIILGKDKAINLFPVPEAQLTVRTLFSSFIIQRNKSETAAPIPSQVAPRPLIISYAAL